MIRKFVNLTNGIEAIPSLDHSWEICRIQSTTIEKENWPLLFADLDHNLLFRLAIGEECIIYDFGAGRKNTKVVYIGIPLIAALLERAWFDRVPYLWDQKYNVEKQYKSACKRVLERADNKIAQHAKRKLGYYKRYLSVKDRSIKLFGVSKETSHDGDIDYYRNIVSNYRGERLLGV